MAKSIPFSMRLSAETDAMITAEARRLKRSKGAVVEALAEEALRMRMFPGIAFRNEDWDRRPWVMGSALDVWQVIDIYRDVKSVDEMVANWSLSEQQVRLALAYYERYPDEIDEHVAQNRLSIEELRELYPSIEVVIDEHWH